jgi:hypothetical protein
MPNALMRTGLLAVPAFLWGQQTLLQITSPTPNSTFSPGQNVTVTVSITSGTVFAAVGLLGSDPLGDFGPLTVGPYQFALALPTQIPYGPYQLTAAGLDGSGNLALSDPLSIMVEPAIPVTTLRVQPAQFRFQFIGQQLPLNVTATLADGSIATLTSSSTVTYASTNPQVVTIGASGFATAVGTGSGAGILVQRGPLSVTVPVTVVAAARGDLNADGVIDQNDLNIILSSLNTPAEGAFDSRDLNKDGVINALDARILVTLCTRSGCATH